ncbi:tetratricopeptide repeat protein [Mastigocladopsis repens]|uniref:tetratricopeptide repeat protein n=1 Tax=Mastigocladopsis repens TaxID=221287 RepID=UPI0002D4A1CF|nr:ATP-binding protein [Mastigocladopsis repens]
MTEDRSAKVGGNADRSAIITGDSNTATITITNYYYHENTTVVPIESTDVSNENLPCPYRGLFHFGPDDAEFFFGREVFVEELFAATQNRNFIPVLGASGSGKSSVVLAGLVPKLQKAGHWLFTHFRPGSEPFHALAEALVPLYEPDKNATEQMGQARQLAEFFVNGSVPLQDVFSKIQRNYPNHRVLLIADQFEELYTLCADQKTRHSFLDILLASFQSSPGKTNVLVATMRADFLGNALSYPKFGDVLRNADVKIRSMNREELSQVIVKPPEKLGVTFQDGLVKRILDDVEDEPGNLPLLEFALTELWKRRKGKQLTHAAYEEIGEVQGALARHADENYGKLSAAQKEQVRQIFIQLVQPGEDRQDTRRVATKAELGEERWKLVTQLADDRLVVTSQNAANQETVEVVHEALIRNWEELRQWMNADRSFRAWQERLRFAMLQWQKMQRDEGALLRGAVLKEAEEKLEQRREELSKGEQEFIQASVALRRGGKQRIYLSLGGIGSILLLAVGFWGWLNYTTPGQLTQIRWNLRDVSQRTSSWYQFKAAVAFAEDENPDQALRLANQIQDSSDKARALSFIAQAYGKLNQPQTAADLLTQAIASAKKIQDSQYKAHALRAIAQAIDKLNQPEIAAALLDKALASANQIQDSFYKATVLSAIAEAYGKLNQPQTAVLLLEKVIASADKIQESYKKADALRAIAQAIGKLNQPEIAAALLEKVIASADKIQESYKKADALRAIAQAIGKLNQPEIAADLLTQAITSADKIQESRNKVDALSAIAEAYGKLNQPEIAATLLEGAIASANQIQDSRYKADALSAIAQAIGKLNQPEIAAALLEGALASAKAIQESQYKADALSVIAQAIGKLNQPDKAADLLKQAIASAKAIQESQYKADALRAIAQAYGKLNQPQTAAPLLEGAIASADKIQESQYKARALSAIAQAIGKLNQPEIAATLLEGAIASANQIQNSSANQIEDSSSKARALRAIAQAIGKLNQPQKAALLLEKALASANQIQHSTYKADALSAIAEAYGKLNQPQKAALLLEKALASANQIQHSIGAVNMLSTEADRKADALSAIAEAAANLKNWEQALKATQQCPSDNCKVELLAKVLTVHVEQQHPELKEEKENEEEE